MEIFFGWLLFSIIPAIIASNKGRSGVAWFFLSLLLSPLFAGLLVLVLSPVAKPTPSVQGAPPPDRIPCSLCKEPVKLGAVRCPHCQGDISEWMAGEEAARASQVEQKAKAKQGEFAGLGATELLNIVKYTQFPEEKRRAAMEKLLATFPGSQEASEATRRLPAPTE